MDVSNQVAQIGSAFGWSCGTVADKPIASWNKELAKDPDAITAIKTYLQQSNISGEMLDIFYWWMGVTLNITQKDLKQRTL